MSLKSLIRSLAIWALLVALIAAAEPPWPETVEFNRDIRPILSDTCFHCHGPDKNARQAGLRLDVRADALLAAESGETPLVPGKPEQSEVIRRILSEDADLVMPPPTLGKPLTARDKELLQRWIAQGAEYQEHWALLPIKRPAVPEVGLHPVDAFIRERLTAEGLQPAVEAERATLIRRISLDLTGLPPTPEEVAAFVGDPDPQAYERVVERLLASPQYGERMAVDWLDAARYADTNGYQVDRDRMAYAWRDWVIRAFNDNKPFDQFTIEQIAGDLLPNATLEQRIATGFNRNHMLNEEGGIIPEEFLAEYTADRVETTATIWLGQTFLCARCHDHKFDPFTQRDFYSLKAFFHNISESGIGNYGVPSHLSSPPFLKLISPETEAQLAVLKQQLEKVKLALAQEPANKELMEQATKLTKEIADIENSIPTALVMEELPQPRDTFILIRGEYNKPGEKVTAATPAVLPPMRDDLPRNRLGLAQWLVDPANPLPARVTMNRHWQLLFGTGLVRTAEDFGSQGEPPSHPELLDWLSAEFISSGWDVKAMLRLLVTSETYRQSSRLTPALQQRDPDNRLLARGPRFRLQGEFIRDQALAIGGLLTARIGGPSVKPYHPPGLYEQVTAGSGTNVYVPSKGDDLYRRSLYTYWKRSVPHPAMLMFDAPFREACTLRRPRTNTPLQALNLLNDPTYVEAARMLAQRMMLEGGDTPETRLKFGFRLALAREPRSLEIAVLKSAWERGLKDFQADTASAAELLKVGEAATDLRLDTAQLAAFTIVASTILNLDETVTKE
jgi:hypothetical protein